MLQSKYFEFNGEVKQQVSGTVIGSKFAPPNVCVFVVHFHGTGLICFFENPTALTISVVQVHR